jgi:biopolymer transport protein ExbD
MAMSLGSSDDDTDSLNAAINTTPLVDVMLVLLIIFLITIPVVTHTVPVSLPKDHNAAAENKPADINIAILRDGQLYFNEAPVVDISDLVGLLKIAGKGTSPPAVHIRGDQDARYDVVGRVVRACKDAGISKIGFITEPH